MNKRSILIRLNTALADLTCALGDDVDLTAEDRLSIENHLLLLQMAYTGWKGRNLVELHDKRSGAQWRGEPGRPLIHQDHLSKTI